jgi:hypothetical protein
MVKPKKSWTSRLEPLVISLLKAQKTEWGYTALNTKEICRRLNKIKDRSFCHNVNSRELLTAKSYSAKRGCFDAKIADIPCIYKIRRVRYSLKKLEKQGKIKSFFGKGLDRKQMGKYIVISKDIYHYWLMI